MGQREMIPKNNVIRRSGYLLLGFNRLKEPGIRWFVLGPLLINILVFGGAGWFAFHEFGRWVNYLFSFIPHWLDFISWALWPLFTLLVIVIIYFTFTMIANIIASPFNAFLAERIQSDYGFKAQSDWRELLLLVPVALSREGKKLLYYLPRVLILLIVSFIPVVNLLSPVLWFIFSAWMMTVQYADYAADNRKVSFKTMLIQLKRNRGRSLAFGTLTLLCTMIPVVNFIVMPAAVIGATCLWEESE